MPRPLIETHSQHGKARKPAPSHTRVGKIKREGGCNQPFAILRVVISAQNHTPPQFPVHSKNSVLPYFTCI
jgi:hypothetical protein